MKKPFLLLIFSGSAAVGWLMHGGVPARGEEHAGKIAEARSPQQKLDKVKRLSAREKEFQDFTKRIPILSDAERHSFGDNLGAEDRGKLIETILKEGNPNRLSNESRSIIESILTIWVTKDFDGAWAWSQRLFPDAYRRYIAGNILDELAKKDLTRALDLHLEMSATDSKFRSDAPLLALEETAGKSASEFLDILGKIPPSGGGSRGFDFAKDFDFQKAAEGVNALLKKQKDIPDQFPSNFIKVWAERDPDAAFAWLSPENETGCNSFRYLLEGIEKQGIPGAASAWVAGKLEESENSRKLIVKGMCSATPANIAGVVKALPDSKSVDRFLSELFIEQSHYYPHDFATTLDRMSSPQVRLETFEKVKKNGVGLTRKISEAEYQKWGVTKQQFETIFPPPEKN